MKNLILFDSDVRDHLLPLTFTRPVGELRVGILTICEKWERWLGGKASYITQDYLADKYPIVISDQNYVINAAVLPTKQLCHVIEQLSANEALLSQGELIAARLDEYQFTRLMNDDDIGELAGFEGDPTMLVKIDQLADLFSLNEQAIRDDFDLLTAGRVSQPLGETNLVLGAEQVFLEEGAVVEGATLNARTGPIYIGKDAEVMEGALIRGPFALCEHGTVKMGAKIYGGTTIGPWSKAGGEIGNSVLLAYSNKGHDGYLGHAYLGEWCNLGADTNNSNLKNNYAEVKLWDYATERFELTGTQFCGLIMGDHSKCGINTMFNTGTVVGVSANIFGSGFPRNFIPSFSWGGAGGFTTYSTEKAFETAELVMTRRQQQLSAEDRIILLRIFEDTAKYRRWEKKN
ncbi:MAG: GlmU family protein [Saprospiraceae bacterium]|nr:GlmU family protein [Saprospiraceae bacterium]MCB0676460.1 GlmU family protein [Saprospiraceae bacterium]MCB0680365.1 GlmU family protein [Saprospiraceae bacterium]